MANMNERIKTVRESNFLTQKDFAKRLGISTSYISRLESQSSTPSFSLLKHISSEFKVNLEWLKTGSGNKDMASSETASLEYKAQLINEGLSGDIVKTILKFRDDRDWKQFHNPKDIAISICLEASELLENFQWSGKDIWAPKKLNSMKDELADVMIYCVLMADALNVDLNALVYQKLIKNGQRYTVNKSYGNSKKYTELELEDLE